MRRANAPIRPARKTKRRSGVLRMISPPRAFSAGYGFCSTIRPPSRYGLHEEARFERFVGSAVPYAPATSGAGHKLVLLYKVAKKRRPTLISSRSRPDSIPFSKNESEFAQIHADQTLRDRCRASLRVVEFAGKLSTHDGSGLKNRGYVRGGHQGTGVQRCLVCSLIWLRLVFLEFEITQPQPEKRQENS